MNRLSGIKIMAPVSNQISMSVGLENGADEFYFGVASGINTKNKWYLPNRRHGDGPNFNDNESAIENIKLAHSHGKKVHITLNSHFYPENFYETFLIMVSDLVKHAPPDSIIVSDLNLILMLRLNFPDLPLTASTICSVYNSRAAGFYSNLGVKRIILPRHISIKEISRITSANPDIEFECFSLYGECANVEGMCCNIGSWGWPCTCLVLNPIPEDHQREAAERYVTYSRRRMDTCRACDILAMVNAGIRHFKIVGREEDEEKIIRGLVFLRQVRDIDESLLEDEKSFQEEVIEIYKRVFKTGCMRRNCYIAPLDMERYGE